ncbi:MAG: aspartate racemase [Candidatus Diapherotrites archaeon]|uniref:Aspartate racemase n=1 Tax=Candidatus Iainarchaeum sp. TaxID=3101447 RepID=A0A2D6LNZ9_9ARCH|nr:aspartate racemase [Candidatus Diapherotrites archaeon]|tara:strand:+ start:10276 stop:10977 length:702 start_codon:yes stop_codon:yes gene_type:complete
MKTETKKIIGILGGMGPESTAIFYHEIILQCQKQYGAQLDEDYPEIFMYNLPIPDVVEGIKNKAETLNSLVKGAKKIESIGVDFMVMPCNTTHYFFKDMKKEISIPFLSIVEETAKKIKEKGFKKIGLLATKTTVENKIYNPEFEEYGIELVIPEEQDKVNKVIMNILAGNKLETDKQELKQVINSLKDKGAEAIVIGCTDIPILLKAEDVEMAVFDTVEILAESTVRYAIEP